MIRSLSARAFGDQDRQTRGQAWIAGSHRNSASSSPADAQKRSDVFTPGHWAMACEVSESEHPTVPLRYYTGRMTKRPASGVRQPVTSRESDDVGHACPQSRLDHDTVLQNFAQMQAELDGLRRASNRLSPLVNLSKTR
jgi:hypothetical protein